MPGYAPKAVLAPFTPAFTEAAVRVAQGSYEPEYIVRNLVELSSYLISLTEHTNMFGTTRHDPFSPSLKTLYDRLDSGHLALSPLSGISKDAIRLRQTLSVRVNVPILSRPLEDFEDLFYALLARMQDMVQTLNVRLASGFNSVTDHVFSNGPGITDLHASLVEYWTILNDAACAHALDDAIRQARVSSLYEEIQSELAGNVITQGDAHKLLEDLFCSKDTTDGLAWIGGWSPAMIGAWLEEKYRVLLQLEKDDDELKTREMRKRAKTKGKIMPVRKASRKGSMSPTKRRSLEKLVEAGLEGMQSSVESTGVLRRGPAQKVTVVEQMDVAGSDAHMEVDHVNQGGAFQASEQSQDGPLDEWRLRSQRVSSYSNYLRGAASRNARSIVDNTVYSNSARRSVLDRFVENEPAVETDKTDF